MTSDNPENNPVDPETGAQGEAAGEFYRPLNLNANQFQWNMSWDTVEGPVHSGGTYKVRLDLL